MNKSEIIGYNKAITNLVNAGLISGPTLCKLWKYTTSKEKRDEYLGEYE